MSDFMRSQPLDRVSSAHRRGSISESHPAFNSLLRRLSNRTKLPSFGRTGGQAKVSKTKVYICIQEELLFSNCAVAKHGRFISGSKYHA